MTPLPWIESFNTISSWYFDNVVNLKDDHHIKLVKMVLEHLMSFSLFDKSGQRNVCVSVIYSQHNKAIVRCSWNSKESLVAQSHDLLMTLGSKRLSGKGRCMLCSKSITHKSVVFFLMFKHLQNVASSTCISLWNAWRGHQITQVL